ncbi:hypothetical protein DH2020_040501 [Rehmannia glutinosa]|uniref:Glutathione hydrolase n=1 Tax=Rehmannia glutinosa TaxID=99300 RepID=A0ABR0UTZ8_REHGL
MEKNEISFAHMSWTVSICLFLLLSCFCPSLTRTTLADVRIVANRGVVATDHGQCSKIGRDVLRDGGHAVDAAVAAALCLGVVSPASSGIGGGAFMLLRSADGKTEAYDMRETAPGLASENMYAGNAALKASGALSVAIPGELAGLEDAWKKYGKIPLKKLVTPSARIAKKGFKISPYLHMQMTKTESGIMADEGLRNIFTSNGSLLQSGDVCYNKQLFETLRMISMHGTKAFYNGSIGLNLVEDVKKAGGILGQDDLQNYRVKVREPVKVDVMGVEIFSMPPPSSGGAALSLILNILAQYEYSSNISDSLMTHRKIEALKNAFAVRMNLGDPDFVDVKNVMKDMLSQEFAAELRKTIFDNTTFNSSHYGGRWNQISDHGTSHISIVDEQRNVVSMTTTINGYFGSKFLSPTTGIILNNEMDDFSMPGNTSENVPPPAPADFIHPGKRPLSSMTPTIVLKDGQLKAVVGASGGSMIIAGTTEVLLNYLARGMDPLSSVVAPRFYHQLIPNVLQYENWTVPTGDHFEVPEETRADLEKKGHILQSLAGGTICQFVVQELNNKTESMQLIGVSDPRKGGFPAVSSRQDAPPAPRGQVLIARSGVVATKETTCSNIGKDVLVNGGHAVEAAVAAAFCLGVVDPPFSGLGGGGFMLVRQASGEAKVFDMTETAPKRASKDFFDHPDFHNLRLMRYLALEILLVLKVAREAYRVRVSQLTYGPTSLASVPLLVGPRHDIHPYMLLAEPPKSG